MTLVAYVDNNPVCIVDITIDDIMEIRRHGYPIRCRGCGGPMHCREVVADKFYIFAHNPGAAERCRLLGGDESEEHDSLKRRLAIAARNYGAKAELEVRFDDECQADVVVTLPSGDQWGLEAQLATLPYRVAALRHEKYVNHIGRCTWIHTRRRDWATKIESLRIDDDEQKNVIGGVYLDVNGKNLAEPQPVTDVVPDLLGDRLRYQWDNHEGYYFYPAGKPGVVAAPTRKAPEYTLQFAAMNCRRTPEGAAELVMTVDPESAHLSLPPTQMTIGQTSFGQTSFGSAKPPFPTDADGRYMYECPRCHRPGADWYYGPCVGCRIQLRNGR